MASKYIALAEETTFGTAGTSWSYYKVLSESINTTREDFFPEGVEYWTPSEKAEGFFRTSGDFEILVEPNLWPKLLAFFIGDPTSTLVTGGTYQHTFKFGADETVSATGVKPFTTKLGVGIEKDRQIVGCAIESLAIEAINRETVSTTVTIIGSGEESLQTAATPSYTAYSQPYLTFADAQTMTVGGVDRLTTEPKIQAFRLTLGRSIDADHYVLGNRFLDGLKLSGMATVEGSLDFAFQSQDEHERFLSAVGASAAGDQASFAIVLTLRGALTGDDSEYYEIQFTIPKAYYSASTVSMTARDRIVQTVDFRGIYDSASGCAAQIDVKNRRADYTALSTTTSTSTSTSTTV